jgi:ABC-2 type transport system ATP-binding protein
VLGFDVTRDPAAVRSRVSLTGQYASVDEDLTGHENLVLISRLLGMSWGDARQRATELLAAFSLSEAASKQVRTFSGGMRRRIDIAASLVTRPDILFLDEPTTGLDPRSRNQVWDLVRQIAAVGTTVLLTTQYLEEADRLAERMAVIDHGRVIAEGTSRELKASIGGNTLRVQLANPAQQAHVDALVSELLGADALSHADPTAISIKVADAPAAAGVLGALSQASIPLSNFSLGTPSLDDVFFALTGKPPAKEAGAETSEARAGSAAGQVAS